MSAYTQPTHLIFGKVKNTDNIYYSTKNQVRGLCVGGDLVILCFCHFTEFVQNGPHPKGIDKFLVAMEYGHYNSPNDVANAVECFEKMFLYIMPDDGLDYVKDYTKCALYDR